jgi:amino acid transporter
MGSYKQELSRELTLRQNILITLSAVTPASSVFIIVPAVLLAVGGASVMAMALGGLVALFVGMCYAELSARYPISGGEYTWAARILGKPIGFAVMLLTLVTGVLIVAVIALGTGLYLGVAVSGLSGSEVGLVVIVLSTIVAALRIKTNAWVTGLFLAVELLAITIFTILGFINVSRPISTFWTPEALGSSGMMEGVSMGLVVSTIAVALFAYNGYGQAVYYAEETKGATKNIGKAIMISLFVALVVEIVPLMAVVLGTGSLEKLLADPAPMNYFLIERGGETLNTIVSLGIAIAIINAVIAIIIQMARLLFSASRDGSFPDVIGKPMGSINAKYQTPVIATAVIGIGSVLVGAFVPFSLLILASGASLIVVYAIVAVAALRVRSMGTSHKSAYTMPFWPVPPIIVIVAIIYIAYQGVLADSRPLLIAIGTMVIGVVYYYIFINSRTDSRWTLPEALHDHND